MFFNEEFLNIYEELTQINEANQYSQAYYIQNIGGFNNGEVVPASETESNLLTYLDKEKTIQQNIHLNLSDDPDDWPKIRTNSKEDIYVFNCPICHSLTSKPAKNIYLYKDQSKKYNCFYSAEQIATCQSCKKREQVKSLNKKEQTNTIVEDSPEIWNRLPAELFIDKSKGNEAVLSNKGYKKLYELNKNNRGDLPATLKSALEQRPENYKIVLNFTKTSELVLPFKCPECKLLYSTQLYNAVRGHFYGCPSCTDASRGAQTSPSESLLKSAIFSIFGADTAVDTPKVGRYRDIDILFSYNNQLVAIEYDGGGFHKGEQQIYTDIKKTNTYSSLLKDKGIKFIRVREPKCDQFPKDLATIITLTNSFRKISEVEFLQTIKTICNTIGYKLTDDDIEKLTALYPNKKK